MGSVVADDAVAKIAARTWIDEYARLGRAQPRNMRYDAWTAQKPADKEVVDGLNAMFWLNTVGKTAAGARQQKDVEPAAEVQKQRKERDNKAEKMKTDLQTNLQREK